MAVQPSTGSMSTAASPKPALTALPDRRGLLVRLGVMVAVLLGLGLAVSSMPGLDELRRRLADAAPGWLAVALALEALSCLAFIAAFRGVFSRRLSWRFSYEVGMAAQGTNVLLPAGGASGLALGAWALRKAGMSTERLARRTVAFFLITSSVNFATAALVGAAVTLGLLAGGGASPALTAVPAALAAGTIAAVHFLPRLLDRPRSPSGRVTRVLAKGGTALGAGIRDARALVRSGSPLVIAGAIGYMALDLAALAAAFAAVGSPPPLGVLALAYVIGQLGGLIPLPGGVGGADGGLIAALALYGTPLAPAVAAVLAYRAFQLGLPALLGALAVIRLPGVLRSVPAMCEPPAMRTARGALPGAGPVAPMGVAAS
ncbi:MAG: flippase-like domain-containing protein [Actinomycetota bacterium]|nr:flippase-like domain-containing protein [Actinomycetota bacterium]